MMGIRVKNHNVLMALMLVPYHPKLIELLCWFTIRNDDIVVVSGFRHGDKGVHGLKPCRGLDLRSRIYDHPSRIVEDTNSHWLYDPKRPVHIVGDHTEPLNCAKYHARCTKCGADNGPPYHSHCECGKDIETGWHIHLQAHFRTERIKGESYGCNLDGVNG